MGLQQQFPQELPMVVVGNVMVESWPMPLTGATFIIIPGDELADASSAMILLTGNIY